MSQASSLTSGQMKRSNRELYEREGGAQPAEGGAQAPAAASGLEWDGATSSLDHTSTACQHAEQQHAAPSSTSAPATLKSTVGRSCTGSAGRAGMERPGPTPRDRPAAGGILWGADPLDHAVDGRDAEAAALAAASGSRSGSCSRSLDGSGPWSCETHLEGFSPQESAPGWGSGFFELRAVGSHGGADALGGHASPAFLPRSVSGLSAALKSNFNALAQRGTRQSRTARSASEDGMCE